MKCFLLARAGGGALLLTASPATVSSGRNQMQARPSRSTLASIIFVIASLSPWWIAPPAEAGVGPPTVFAFAGGPYTISEGSALMLNGSGSCLLLVFADRRLGSDRGFVPRRCGFHSHHPFYTADCPRHRRARAARHHPHGDRVSPPTKPRAQPLLPSPLRLFLNRRRLHCSELGSLALRSLADESQSADPRLSERQKPACSGFSRLVF